MDCLTCKSVSGEQPISPCPRVYEGSYWLIDHAYPCGMKGWLVLVLKRHAEALHELSIEEFSELGALLGRTVTVLHRELGSEKEYVMCFGEAEGFSHIHVHVVPKPKGLPDELRGPRIFAMLRVEEVEVVPREELREFCEGLRKAFSPY